jgi:hypothetical protein
MGAHGGGLDSDRAGLALSIRDRGVTVEGRAELVQLLGTIQRLFRALSTAPRSTRPSIEHEIRTACDRYRAVEDELKRPRRSA